MERTGTSDWFFRFRVWLMNWVSPYKRETAGSQLHRWSTSKPFRHWSCFRSSIDYERTEYTCELVWTSITPIVSLRFKASTPQDARQRAAEWIQAR